jgi:ribosomal protein S18 acetylase RimI-like enzyme
MAAARIRQAGRHDLIGVHDVGVEASRALGEPVFTLAQQREFWERTGFDPGKDAWVATDEETVLGFGELHTSQDVLVRTRPGTDGGLHHALLETLEAAARARGMEFVAANLPDIDTAAVSAYETAGYAKSREVWRMWVEHTEEPPAPALPEGVTIRPYTSDDGDAVHELLDAAYTGWDDDYVPIPHREWLSFMTDHGDFDPGCWFLAESDHRLVGVCLNWRDGWVKDLAVHPNWRRRGLGEALLRHAFRELWQNGVRRIGLKVDSNNGTGAPRLYERLGFVTDRRYPMFLKRL